MIGDEGTVLYDCFDSLRDKAHLLQVKLTRFAVLKLDKRKIHKEKFQNKRYSQF